MRKKFTKEEFIQKSKDVHGDKYDYSKVEYTHSQIKVIIICPVHGEFQQTPNSHSHGKGCSKCRYDERKFSREEFIIKAKQIQGETYDYSKVVYINNSTKVCIICPVHGEFWQTPVNHLNNRKCLKCFGRRKLSNEQWLNQIFKINKNIKFLTKYTGMNSHIKCQCLICNHIWQNTPAHLKSGQGCPKCANCIKHTQEQFENDLKLINPNITILGKYIKDIVHIEYKCNVCGLIHSASPSNLKQGYGCPKCNASKGEKQITKLLKEQNINFIPQYKLQECKNKKHLPFDFYLPEHNICIEYDGEQHYKPVRINGMSKERAIEKFNSTQRNDSIKTKYCKDNNIHLIRIPYWDINNIPNILETVL